MHAIFSANESHRSGLPIPLRVLGVGLLLTAACGKLKGDGDTTRAASPPRAEASIPAASETAGAVATGQAPGDSTIHQRENAYMRRRFRRLLNSLATQELVKAQEDELDEPENYDKQKLPSGAGGFGPLATVVPLTGIQKLSDTDFLQGSLPATGIGLASVDVDTDAEVTQATYTAIGLTQGGLHCVSVKGKDTVGNPNGVRWDAFVWKFSSGTGCDKPAASDVVTPLEAVVVKDASYSDYATVTRWDEGRTRPPSGGGGPPERDQPTIGVRCGSQWCEIGPPGFNPKAAGASYRIPRNDPDITPKSAKTHIKGWYDEQRLAEDDGTGLKPKYRAYVVPVATLGTIHDFSTYVEVARVRFFDQTDRTKKYFAAGLDRGINILRLKREANGTWKAEIQNVNTGRTVSGQRVTRDPHTPPPPAAARWRWNDQDEDLWVRCEDGCCHVSLGVF